MVPAPVPAESVYRPSMKVPPKRKGNGRCRSRERRSKLTLNESPSEKEGKSVRIWWGSGEVDPSMKVPPKRKGNRGRRFCLP